MLRLLLLVVLVATGLLVLPLVSSQDDMMQDDPIQLGPRPFWLVEDMDESALRDELAECAAGPFVRTNFSIGHRGAPMQFPEHTVESYEAAYRMGAGILECDVTFTADRELVCRHAQCDLHTTTNILAIPELAAKCSEGFTPAVLDENGNVVEPARARCCTSDITLEEFRMLEGKMDAFDPAAQTVEAYLGGTAGWRTDLYATRGTLLTHAESIDLFASMGVGMTPELKSPEVAMPFEGDYTQEDYAQQLVDEYIAAGIDPSQVWPQSFNYGDVLYWVNNTDYGDQAVFLDGRYDLPAFAINDLSTHEPSFEQMVADGVQIVAPPMQFLVDTDGESIVPSVYAQAATEAGLDIISWTIERSGTLLDGGGFYYSTISDVINNPGDMMDVMHVLAQDVGIIGLFSDWPATTTYYASCFGLE